MEDDIRRRIHEITRALEPGSPEETAPLDEREFTVAHDYDTPDRDLEQLGMTLARLPAEAGVEWRLTLPRGERVEAWEPGTNGLAPPPDVLRLIGSVVAGKPLVPGPPLSHEAGALRLRRMLDAQRVALLTHDPGVRLGDDPENLHQHRVAARRARAFVRTASGYLDAEWRRSVGDALQQLGEATGPARDLDVVLEHIREELDRLDETEQAAKAMILERLGEERERVRTRLLGALDGADYRFVLARLRLPPRLAEGVEAIPLEALAKKEFRRVARLVERLGRQPDERGIHRLRISLKRARYAAELAAPKGTARKRFLADARVLQELLGEHQDAVVAEQRLRSASIHDVRTAAAFAAGRLAERQRLRRARVQERLPVAWRRLRKSGSRLI